MKCDRRSINILLGAVLIMLLAVSCGGGGVKKLSGLGTHYADYLYTKMFGVYNKKTGIAVTYTAVSIKQLASLISAQRHDFYGTDVPLTDEQQTEIGQEMLYIPICISTTVVAYNLPSQPRLRIDGRVLAQIYLGHIRSWNDPAIQKLNPNADLPDLRISVIYNKETSDNTCCLSAYLSKTSPEFKAKVGQGTQVRWPVGQGAGQDKEIIGVLKKTSGAIGYMDMAYVLPNNLQVFDIKNKAGAFITPSFEASRNAAAVDMPDNAVTDINYNKKSDGYPVVKLSYLLLYKDLKHRKGVKNPRLGKIRARETLSLIWWMVHGGQKLNEDGGYSRLPENVVRVAEKQIDLVRYNGDKISYQKKSF